MNTNYTNDTNNHLTSKNTKNTNRLRDEEGKEIYAQGPAKSYSLYADYYWYETGDVICIGGSEMQFYCLPEGNVPVAKASLATEELFRLTKKKSPKDAPAGV